jgi:Cd2+/Zn2+-exporting ATPase
VPLPGRLADELARLQERGATPLIVVEDRTPVGILSVTDQLRPGACETVARLRTLGIELVGVVSGDHQRAAHAMADAVGADECWAGLAPDDKPGVVRGLQSRNLTVMFVGDGVNDAPALATADVGVAMGAAGTDVALETADIALMRDDVTKLPLLIGLGRRMLRVITWNIAFGMAFNALAVVASGAGYLTPIAGAIVHNLGSVLVVLSSATMAFVREKEKRAEPSAVCAAPSPRVE